MAIARQQVGVRPGYKARTRRVVIQEQREPTRLQKFMVALLSSLREMREFASDEIVYATMDTIRLLEWLKYELGFRPARRAKPVGRERDVVHMDGPFVQDTVNI